MHRSLKCLTSAGLVATLLSTALAQAVLAALPFSDRQDFENAQRGFIAKPETLNIKDASGKVVWDLESYKQSIALDRPAPDSVNPSLSGSFSIPCSARKPPSPPMSW